MGPNPEYLGRSFAMPRPYRVGAEKIAEFAAATGASNAAHFDTEAARLLGYRDVVAPPTFAVIIAQRAEAAYVQDPDARIDFSQVVHAEEGFVHHRPIVAGDVLDATVTVTKIVQRAALAMVTTRTDITSADDGAPVSSVTSTLAIRAVQE